MGNIKFYTFRYFLIPSLQITFEQMTIKDKKQLIIDIFNKLNKESKIEREINNRKYILYLRKKLSDDIYICKFGREVIRNMYDIGIEDIEEKKASDYPYIYFIVDTSKQIFFIEEKTSVFRELNYAKDKIRKFFEYDLRKKNFNMMIDEITESKSFWQYINNADKIFELKLNMKSPNAFQGILNANELLKKMRGFFNNTEMDMNLKNEDGKLNINEENSKDYIDYITHGGGKWEVVISNNKHKENIKSTDKKYIKNISIPENFEEILKLSSEENKYEKKEIQSKIIDFKDILGDRKNEENKDKHKE
ncbi:hypothetical protein [Clostridium botulinum]|uniref:hypothetical protein n=1 Tax=Clostridium botulinum TaxID=1491 RepID=UPI003DA36DD4